jgi:hypothetical protein
VREPAELVGEALVGGRLEGVVCGVEEERDIVGRQRDDRVQEDFERPCGSATVPPIER